MKQIVEEEEEYEENDDNHEGQIIGFNKTKAHHIVEKPCQCTCNAATASTDSVEQARLIREPLSAPF